LILVRDDDVADEDDRPLFFSWTRPVASILSLVVCFLLEEVQLKQKCPKYTNRIELLGMGFSFTGKRNKKQKYLLCSYA
jgi:hypothetical protein